MAYRIYLTDALRVLTENTAKFAGGSMINIRYFDVIDTQKKNPEKKTGDEIVVDIVKRAGLEIV